MSRLILLLGGVALIVAIILGLKACQDGTLALHPPKIPAPVDLSSIVILHDGSVLTAPQGTIGRDLVDWLASPTRTSRYFELGGQEFVGRSAEPTIDSKVRIERLVDMLESSPDVTVKVLGFTAATGNRAADLRLSRARADWVVEALHDDGIARSRLSAEGRGGADAIASNATSQGRARNERVALLLQSHR
jgi:hypothetical protein